MYPLHIFWLFPLVVSASLGKRATLNATTIFEFPNNGSWIENQAHRPNGKLLVTRADTCQLWSIDSWVKNGTLAVEFNNCTSALGITEISHDVFAVVTGKFVLTTLNITARSWLMYRVDYSNSSNSTDKPSVSLLTTMPEVTFPNGAATFSNDTILIADSINGSIWKMNSFTGEHSIAVSDPTMLPANGNPLGINGVKAWNNYLYYTSSGAEKFCRVPVFQNVSSSGPVQVIAQNFTMDDFTITKNGTAYIGGTPSAMITQVTSSGNVSVLIQGLNTDGATSCKFGSTYKDNQTLYVTFGGQAQGEVVALHL